MSAQKELKTVPQVNPSAGINTSGISPLGFAVLVQTYEPEMKSSVIQIPDHVRNQMQSADQRAIVIEVGPHAWSDESVPRAHPGDRVLITKYAGYVTNQTADGKQYRLINDRDIFARINWEQ